MLVNCYKWWYVVVWSFRVVSSVEAAVSIATKNFKFPCKIQCLKSWKENLQRMSKTKIETKEVITWESSSNYDILHKDI